ncbi:MAG TPA: cation diffusion facilitator family transporter [Polyangiales bacterium]|nr:cation diffusion facilitator family transporter [Polyangiales bacterium]
MASTPPPEDTIRMLRRATNLSLGVATGLALAKAAAWLLTGSVAILASLVDSAMDASASLLTALAVRYSLVPADDEHRFGHGKSEALAGLAQALFITASTAFLVVHAVQRFLRPQPLEAVPIGIGVMTVSILATLGLVLYQRRVVRATESAAIRGDSLHYASDLLTNFGTIAALALSRLGFPQLDPLIAIAIASATMYGALRIGWDTFQVLMDRELPVELQQQIRSIALGHTQVTGVHDLRTRQSGHCKLIQMHLEMDGQISLDDAHRVADDVERAIRDAIPGADVVIHQEPSGLDDERQFS